MSFMMFARPMPTEAPESQAFLSVKRAVASVLFDSDGSLRGDVVVDNHFIPVLTGMKAMTTHHESKEEINQLIRMINDNPQGVRIWIGDPDEF